MKSSILAGLVLAALLLSQSSQTLLPGGVVDISEVNGGAVGSDDDDFSEIDGGYEMLGKFSDRLWGEVAGKAEVLSPISAYMALAMTAGGARGTTLDAFGCLGIGSGESELSAKEAGAKMRALIDSLTAKKGSTKLSIANSVWVDEKFELKKDFVKFLKKYYSADAFSENLPASVGKVNSWIEEKTNGLICDMLDEIDPATALLLINTIYMDAKWAVPFEKEATYKEDFTSASGEKVSVDMMHRIGRMSTIDADGLEGIVLPYDDGRLQFVALMPTEGTTSELISTLVGERSIGALATTAKTERVRLTLPKLELSSAISLKQPLIAMGMGEAFGDSADFSGLCEGDTGFCISEVLQNARLRLDEEGTEAAAATVVSVKTTSIIHEAPPREMAFDKPFVWAVVDTGSSDESGIVLFCGQVDKIG